MSIRINSDGQIINDGDDLCCEELNYHSEGFKLRQDIANKLREGPMIQSDVIPLSIRPINKSLSKFYMNCYSQLLGLFRMSCEEMSDEEKSLFHLQAKLLRDKAIEFQNAYAADNPDILFVPLHFEEMW